MKYVSIETDAQAGTIGRISSVKRYDEMSEKVRPEVMHKYVSISVGY